MEAEDLAILSSVKQDVSELRKLGEEWGLSPLEITSCINSAFNTKLEIKITEKIAKKIQSGTRWSKIRFAFRVWLAFVVVIFGFTLMVTQTEYLSDKVAQLLQPHAYHMFRVIRLAALPMHEQFNISTYHNEECLITNPYFLEAEQECYACEGTDSVRVTRLKKEKELSMEHFEQPLLIRELQFNEVDVMDIVDMIQKEEILHDPGLKVRSTVDWVQSVNDLGSDTLLDDILTSENFNVEWTSRRIGMSQLLKKLFPRPIVLPSKLEVVIDKSLYISGPHADAFPLAEGIKSRYSFYVQGSGYRTVEFYSKPGCEDICSPFTVATEPGDILFFPNAWEVILAPNEEEISVAFLGGAS